MLRAVVLMVGDYKGIVLGDGFVEIIINVIHGRNVRVGIVGIRVRALGGKEAGVIRIVPQ